MSTDLIAFDDTKLDLIKRTVAKGASNDELALFLHACQRTGLDPLMKQIHAIKRWSAADQREVMAIQTGIDGYRLVADRTGNYVGSDDPVFDETHSVPAVPIKATVTVWKLVGGQRCAFTASARWEEYVQKKKDGAVTSMWQRMPYLMLAKCAEALALRKAFPAELSGVYTHEEMMQADNPPPPSKPLVNIPDVRPQTGNRDLSPASKLTTDRYTGEPIRQEEEGVEGLEPRASTPVTQKTTQINDAPPAPISAAAFAKSRAESMPDTPFVEGIIGNYQPYEGQHAYQKGVKPGLFDVEDGQGGIVLAGIRFFDPKLELTSGVKRVYYKTDTYKGRTQHQCVKIEALE